MSWGFINSFFPYQSSVYLFPHQPSLLYTVKYCRTIPPFNTSVMGSINQHNNIDPYIEWWGRSKSFLLLPTLEHKRSPEVPKMNPHMSMPFSTPIKTFANIYMRINTHTHIHTHAIFCWKFELLSPIECRQRRGREEQGQEKSEVGGKEQNSGYLSVKGCLPYFPTFRVSGSQRQGGSTKSFLTFFQVVSVT